MRDGGNPDAHPTPRAGEDRFSLGDFRRLAKGFRIALLSAAAVIAAFAVGAPAPAEAHGRLGAAEGRCRLFIGPDIMNFTGYLPEASKNEFCEDIPATGPMIMVLDAEQDELRDMKIELRIVKDIGGEERENENLQAVTVAYREPKSYPTGTINFEHTFDEPGYFVGIVTVTGDHGERWVSRFPFSVGKSFMRDLPIYLTLGLGTVAAFVIYLVHRRRETVAVKAHKPPPPPPPPPTTPDEDHGPEATPAE
ncbi:hypothetical protein [Methylocystis sp. B8]|uniref:hypothetical protein n=1 Tax=Methylocystis sp. B8 TaxID=544938 RepID=UPI0010FF1EF6|nr:hypothetical protein [Methylocystis sp. B8]TLG78209.1 hypothetical protein FEV16_06520 [Methylocystis sp. B8]